MPRIKLIIEYDGTNYVGWQLQANGPSVQGRVQRALQELTGQPISVLAAGRTDAGVHARGQVAVFDAPTTLPMRAYWMGLNGFLPEDIAVVSAEVVADSFDPRRWSRGKRYRYRVGNRRSRSPLLRLSHWEIFLPLNVAAMQDAVRHVVGRHDFSAFRAADCQARHALREIVEAEVLGVSGDEIAFVFRGTAFLKHMVRNLVGTLVEVGRGKQPPEWMRAVLDGGDRAKAGPTAPPQGLVLEEVFYGTGPREEVSDDD